METHCCRLEKYALFIVSFPFQYVYLSLMLQMYSYDNDNIIQSLQMAVLYLKSMICVT